METIQIKNATPPDPTPTGAPTGGMAMEVAHVLFMDLVGYSKLRMQQQADLQVELQNLVQNTPEVQQARKDNKLIVRPTGDGMALLFLRDLVSPVRCAIQLHTALQKKDDEIKRRIGAPIRLRMGIHSGPVFMMEDMNAQSDVAGDGIILAQRVMDCGDAGHILISDEVARKLIKIDPWPRYITDLGECRVKHGVMVHLYNLYGRLDGPFCGNPAVPKKVNAENAAMQAEVKKYQPTFWERHPSAKGWIAFWSVALAVGGGGYYAWATNPGLRQSVQTNYAKLMNPAKPAEGKETPKSKSGAKGGKTAAAKSGGAGKAGGGRTAPVASGSAAESLVTVPDLLGRTLEDARYALDAEGLRIKKSDKSGYNTKFAEGMIYSQNPPAGASVSKGKVVFVRVSKGDPPDPSTQLPEPPLDTEVEE